MRRFKQRVRPSSWETWVDRAAAHDPPGPRGAHQLASTPRSSDLPPETPRTAADSRFEGLPSRPRPSTRTRTPWLRSSWQEGAARGPDATAAASRRTGRGRLARRRTTGSQQVVAAAILANPTGYDGVSFFNASHPSTRLTRATGTFANVFTGRQAAATRAFYRCSDHGGGGTRQPRQGRRVPRHPQNAGRRDACMLRLLDCASPRYHGVRGAVDQRGDTCRAQRASP